MTATALMLLMAAAAGTDDSWLEVRTDGTCPAPHLAEQIAERIVGQRNVALRVEVELRVQAGAIVAAICVSRGFEALGGRTLLAPTCEEALAAVTAIVGLALSHGQEVPSRSSEHEERAQPSGAAPAPPQLPSPRRPLPTPSTRSTLREHDAPAAAAAPDERAVRIVGAAGIDLGTLVEPWPVLGAGARVGTTRGELRGFAWYGLRSTREEVSEVTERTRADFFALSLDYCHGLDEQGWLGLCGGIEASLKRTSRLKQGADARVVEEERIEPSLGPLLGAAIAYRAARWIPELGVSVQLPLVGAGAHSRLGFRGAIGAALPF